MTNLFSSEYLFNPVPPQESKLYIPLLILFSLLIIFAVAVKFIKNKDLKSLSERYFVSFLTCGLLGFIYLSARFEGLPWLASRFFLLSVLTITFIWIVANSLIVIMHAPKYKQNKKIEDRYNKYLPKAKSK